MEYDGITFKEDAPPPSEAILEAQAKKDTSLASWLVKHGVAKDEALAKKVLFIGTIVFFVLAFVPFLYTGITLLHPRPLFDKDTGSAFTNKPPYAAF